MATLTTPPRTPAAKLAAVPQPVEGPVWIPVPQGAERVSLCDRTIRRAIAAGELPGYKFGKALRVRVDELDAWATAKVIPSARSGRPVRAGGASR